MWNLVSHVRPTLRCWYEIGESYHLLRHPLSGLCPVLQRNPTPPDDTLCHAPNNEQSPTCLEYTEKCRDCFAGTTSKDTRFLAVVIMATNLGVRELS